MAASRDGFSGLYGLAGALAMAVLSFSASTQAAFRLASNSGHAVIAPSYVATAQGFTTGSDVGGYDLESVELFLGLVPSSDLGYELVTLHADDAGIPGDLVAALANPENLEAGSNSFQAPASTVLEADTTYYLVVNLQGDAGLSSDWASRRALATRRPRTGAWRTIRGGLATRAAGAST